MTDAPDRAYWRVGYHADPAGFVPLELCTFNHRFDDVQQRFRSIYVAETASSMCSSRCAPYSTGR